jgi:uncharacterized protein (DUF433 family)
MPQTSTKYEHIALDDGKVPVIEGTRFKVSNIIASQMAHGWSPEEIRFQFPDLTMGQIHSALAYYHDHSDYFEQLLEKELIDLANARQAQAGSPFIRRLKDKGLL